MTILSEVGELWKSVDPPRALLGVVTTHTGHDYRVDVGIRPDVGKYQSPNGIQLYLFDERNSYLGHLDTSVQVLIGNGHFDVKVINGSSSEWVDRKAQTIDELKAVIADLWAAGQITASKQ